MEGRTVVGLESHMDCNERRVSLKPQDCRRSKHEKENLYHQIVCLFQPNFWLSSLNTSHDHIALQVLIANWWHTFFGTKIKLKMSHSNCSQFWKLSNRMNKYYRRIPNLSEFSSTHLQSVVRVLSYTTTSRSYHRQTKTKISGGFEKNNEQCRLITIITNSVYGLVGKRQFYPIINRSFLSTKFEPRNSKFKFKTFTYTFLKIA